MEHDVYWQMYCDIWAYHKKYINNLQDGDEFWDKLIADGKAVAKKYDNDRFIVSLVVNELKEFKRVYEERQKGQQK